jgi:CII-binding regulator of phage lambda lysogenization HflD
MHEYKIENLPAHHSALANMDISLHSMEVVYKLATFHKIHSEFLHVFVMGLFSRCGSSSKKILGGREEKLVRLVAIFIQNLIQNDIIHVEDFVEIQAFCIEFSKVREVQMLFKLIKTTK